MIGQLWHVGFFLTQACRYSPSEINKEIQQLVILNDFCFDHCFLQDPFVSDSMYLSRATLDTTRQVSHMLGPLGSRSFSWLFLKKVKPCRGPCLGLPCLFLSICLSLQRHLRHLLSHSPSVVNCWAFCVVAFHGFPNENGKNRLKPGKVELFCYRQTEGQPGLPKRGAIPAAEERHLRCPLAALRLGLSGGRLRLVTTRFRWRNLERKSQRIARNVRNMSQISGKTCRQLFFSAKKL